MKKALSLFTLPIVLFCFTSQLVLASDTGGYAGTVSITLSAGTQATPSYKVVSAVSADPVYTGVITSVTSNTISFGTETDSEGTETNPFVTGAFKSTVKVPVLTASLNSGSVNSIAVTYAEPDLPQGILPKSLLIFLMVMAMRLMRPPPWMVRVPLTRLPLGREEEAVAWLPLFR